MRIGLDATDRETAFTLYDVGGRMRFEPWLTWGDGWSLGMSLIGSTGLLNNQDHAGLIIGLGPRLELRFPPAGWMFYISSRASLLSRNEFNDIDLGGWFIFSTISASSMSWGIISSWNMHSSTVPMHASTARIRGSIFMSSQSAGGSDAYPVMITTGPSAASAGSIQQITLTQTK